MRDTREYQLLGLNNGVYIQCGWTLPYHINWWAQHWTLTPQVDEDHDRRMTVKELRVVPADMTFDSESPYVAIPSRSFSGACRCAGSKCHSPSQRPNRLEEWDAGTAAFQHEVRFAKLC